MSKKRRGNDAIPTWSGFNYQGKITLLCLLIEINNLISDDCRQELLEDCYVEIEKTEDIVLVLQGKVKALYQVKAYLSTDKTASFSKAIEKLMEHRSKLKSLAADCYICTPLSISDWNDTGNRYKNQIKQFVYNSKPVHVTEVADKIREVLKKTLKYAIFISRRNAINKSQSTSPACGLKPRRGAVTTMTAFEMTPRITPAPV